MRGTRCRRPGVEPERVALAVNRYVAEAFGENAQPRMFEEQFHFSRGRSEAVPDFVGQTTELFGVLGRRNALVEPHALPQVVQPGLGDGQLEAEVHGAARPADLAARVRDRLLEEAVVEIEPHRLEVSVLRGAEQVSGSAQFEVEGGDAEPRSELAELPEGGEARARRFGHLVPRGDEEPGERPPATTGRRAPDLVQLGESETVGAVDDQSIDARQIESVLDDRGREQDVGFAFLKAQQRPGERALMHLPVCGQNPGFGNERRDLLLNHAERLDLIVEKVDLTAPGELGANRFPDPVRIERCYVRGDRHPPLRSGLDHRQVADAGERHVQRARNGRRGHGEVVHGRSETLESLLGAHAEALFLVHHEQAEVAERDVFREEPMGSDHDVHLPRAQTGGHRAPLARRTEPGEHLHPDRKGAEPGLEESEMLGRQQRRGREHRHLFAVHGGLECGAESHLGLAEPHISGEQSVHRNRGFHVRVHLADRARLIGRLGPLEAILEFGQPGRVRSEGVPRGPPPLGIQPHQLVGDVLKRPGDAFLASRPPGSSESVQSRGVRTGARGVLLEEIETLDRKQQFRPAGVPQLHELRRVGAVSSSRVIPRNRPMPCFEWTTGSPGLRSRKSDRNVRVRAPRRGRLGGACMRAVPLSKLESKNGKLEGRS